MSQTIIDNLDFIKQLAFSSNHQSLLRKATNKNLKALSEICLNLLRGNLHVDFKTKKKLKQHQKSIQTLANKRVSLKKKRKVLNQKGSFGFLAPLASIAVPIIADLIAKNIKKKRK